MNYLCNQEGAKGIRVPFDEEKAVEADSLLVSLAGKRMGRWRLNKLMYLAEREAWERYERPIFGGAHFSLDHGPISSEILDLTQGKRIHGLWPRHFRNGGIKGRDVCLTVGAPEPRRSQNPALHV